MATNHPLAQAEVDFLQRMARSGEGQYLREKVLKPWLAAIDRRLRTAINDVQIVQGEAQMIDRLIDLLTVKAPPEKTRRPIEGVGAPVG